VAVQPRAEQPGRGEQRQDEERSGARDLHPDRAIGDQPQRAHDGRERDRHGGRDQRIAAACAAERARDEHGRARPPVAANLQQRGHERRRQRADGRRGQRQPRRTAEGEEERCRPEADRGRGGDGGGGAQRACEQRTSAGEPGRVASSLAAAEQHFARHPRDHSQDAERGQRRDRDEQERRMARRHEAADPEHQRKGQHRAARQRRHLSLREALACVDDVVEEAGRLLLMLLARAGARTAPGNAGCRRHGMTRRRGRGAEHGLFGARSQGVVADAVETMKRLAAIAERMAHGRELVPELVGCEAALDRAMKAGVALLWALSERGRMTLQVHGVLLGCCWNSGHCDPVLRADRGFP